jgi:hypothetical protein
MKTTRDWLKDYEWFPQVEANANEQRCSDVFDVEVSGAVEALSGAFVWEYSQEGSQYWYRIHESLEQ